MEIDVLKCHRAAVVRCSLCLSLTVMAAACGHFGFDPLDGGTADRFGSVDGNANGYRMPVTVANSGQPLSDFQVRIDLLYNAHMKPDFVDVRFTDADGKSPLLFWKQAHQPSTSAVFWVRVPQVPTGSSTIYLYYGDPTSKDASDGPGTFVFFDSFQGTSLDSSKWVSGSDGASSITVSGGHLTLQTPPFYTSGTYWSFVASQSQLTLPLSIELSIRTNAGSCCGYVGVGTTQASTYSAPDLAAFATASVSEGTAVFQVNSSPVATRTLNADLWALYSIKLGSGASSCSVYSHTYANPAVFTESPVYLKLAALKADSGSTVIDSEFVAVRKFAAVEPIATVGAEERH
jgi:hypothetical protein